MRKTTRLVFRVFLLLVSLTGYCRVAYGQAASDTAYKIVPRDSTVYINTAKSPQRINETKDTGRRTVVTPFVNQDSLAFAMRPHPFQPNPKKAGLYSAILPGLGQAYNRQYWKVPVVYVGLGVAGYFIGENLTKYRSYRKGYVSRISNPNYQDEYTAKVSPDQIMNYLKTNQDQYYKYLDLTVLLTGVGYFLQVVDAITSAHLKNFDISRDISMHISPIVAPNGAGFGLVMNF